jgi:hypothetical protein
MILRTLPRVGDVRRQVLYLEEINDSQQEGWL